MIPDALSRLDSGVVGAMEGSVLDGTNVDEYEGAYHATLVEMSDDFKARLTQVYAANIRWTRILALVQPANGEEPSADTDTDFLDHTDELYASKVPKVGTDTTNSSKGDIKQF